MGASGFGSLADEWRDRFGRYSLSQWTVAEFCLIEGISVSSFYQWRRKLEESTVVESTGRGYRADFAPVRLVGSTSAIVHLPGGTRLEIPVSDVDALERALDVVVRADARRAEVTSC